MALALQFDGVNDHLTRATPDSYNGNLTNYRWVARAIRDSSSNLYFIGRVGSFNDYISQQSSVFRIRYGSSTVSWNATVPVSTNEVEWTVTRNGNTHELFIDGVSQGTVSSSGTSSAVKGYIGRANNSNTAAIKLIKMQLWDANEGGSLLSNYDATTSSHAAGTAVLTDTVGGNNGTGVNMPTDGSAWVDLGGGGISIAVTEVKSNRIDLSSLSISANLSIATTEIRSSRVESSVISIAGNVIAAVTEIKSSRVDNSSVTIDVSALSILVTEIKGSRVDLSSIDIKKEIDLIVTEIKASRQDFSLLNIPVIITINPKNIIRVKRKENTVRVKRNSNIIRVK